MEADVVGRIFAFSGTSFFQSELVATRVSYAGVFPTPRLPYLNVVQIDELQIAVGWFEGARSPAPLENAGNVFPPGPQFTRGFQRRCGLASIPPQNPKEGGGGRKRCAGGSRRGKASNRYGIPQHRIVTTLDHGAQSGIKTPQF
jgi:hypothetical protein